MASRVGGSGQGGRVPAGLRPEGRALPPPRQVPSRRKCSRHLNISKPNKTPWSILLRPPPGSENIKQGGEEAPRGSSQREGKTTKPGVRGSRLGAGGCSKPGPGPGGLRGVAPRVPAPSPGPGRQLSGLAGFVPVLGSFPPGPACFRLSCPVVLRERSCALICPKKPGLSAALRSDLTFSSGLRRHREQSPRTKLRPFPWEFRKSSSNASTESGEGK